MRKLSVCFLLFAALLGAETFTSPKGDYSITFPDTWKMEQGFMNTDVMASAPLKGEKDKFRDNVIVGSVDMETPVTLEEYYRAGRAGLEKQLQNFRFLRSGRTTIAGVPARWIKYRHAFGKTRAEVIQYLFIKGKRSYVITCTAEPEAFEEMEAEFKRIVRSFAFRAQ